LGIDFIAATLCDSGLNEAMQPAQVAVAHQELSKVSL
jgi:hypothetical protein